MRSFQFWEYPLSFSDPASVYAYHLFSVHNDVIWFLILIIILVYWMLYKIIRDFHWRAFNNQNSLLIPLYEYIITIEFNVKFYCNYIYIYIIQSYLYCRDANEIYNLGAVYEINDFTIYLLMWYNNKLNIIFGFSETYDLFVVSLKDIEGKVFFNDEIFLLDSQWRSICLEDYSACLEILTKKEVKMYVIDKYLSYALFHYTTHAYFNNGYINISQFFLRKLRPFYKISNFAILDILNVISTNPIYIPRAIAMFSYDSLLRDSLFEAQDFKHSFTFELIRAIFPTIIIISILVPSLYLLYSLDEDLDPRLTIKVIGHHDIDLMNLIIE